MSPASSSFSDFADDETKQSNSAAGSALLSLLGVDLKGVTAQLGLGCSPISAIGVGSGKACASNAVCCQNNNVVSVLRLYLGCLNIADTLWTQGGLISIGCAPISL